jgi:hypothetical protein
VNESHLEERLHAAYAASEDLVGVNPQTVLEIGRRRRLRRRAARVLAVTIVGAGVVLGVHALVPPSSTVVPGGPSPSPSFFNSTPTTWSGPSMSIDGQRYVIRLGPIDARTVLAELYRLDSNGHLTDLSGAGGGTVTGGQPIWGGGTSLVPNLTFGVFAEGSHDFTCALASGKPYPCTVATMPVTLDGRSYVAMAMTLPTGENIKSFLGKVSWTDSAGTRHTSL